MDYAAAALPPPRVTHNYGGVQGLHLLTDAFSEEVERKLFRLLGPPADAQLLRKNDSRHVHGTKLKFTQGMRFDDSPGAKPLPSWDMENHPPELFKLTNLIRDSGLHPSFIHPNGPHGICYPPKANFPHHFDSRFKYGECVAGVSIGFPSAIYFHAADKRTQEENRQRNGGENKQVVVPLPPRSIYIMSGDAFLKWKHGIKATCYEGQALPSWVSTATVCPTSHLAPRGLTQAVATNSGRATGRLPATLRGTGPGTRSESALQQPPCPSPNHLLRLRSDVMPVFLCARRRRSITMRSSKHYSNLVLSGKIPSALPVRPSSGSINVSNGLKLR